MFRRYGGKQTRDSVLDGWFWTDVANHFFFFFLGGGSDFFLFDVFQPWFSSNIGRFLWVVGVLRRIIDSRRSARFKTSPDLNMARTKPNKSNRMDLKLGVSSIPIFASLELCVHPEFSSLPTQFWGA